MAMLFSRLGFIWRERVYFKKNFPIYIFLYIIIYPIQGSHQQFVETYSLDEIEGQFGATLHLSENLTTAAQYFRFESYHQRSTLFGTIRG